MTRSIAIYTHSFHPVVGGVEISCRVMAQELVALGYAVTVITKAGLGDATELDEGYRILRAPDFRALVAEARQSDLFLVRGGLSKVAVLAGRFGGARVLCLHEMMAEGPVPLQERVLSRLVHTHLGVTKAALETKGLLGRARTGLLYNPVLPAFWPKAARPWEARDIDLLFVGRLGPAKGIIEFAQACAALSVPFQAAIVGEGPKRAEVEKILQGRTEVRFVGLQQGAALADLYARARALVLPSYAEGMGMVVAEAMSHGTPALVSDIPTLRETMGSGGMTFAPQSSEAVAQAATQILSDRALWQRLSTAAWEERARFSLVQYRATLRRHVEAALPT